MLTRLVDILSYPTVVDNNHESLYRAYQILNYVEELLADGIPARRILDIIQDLHHKDNVALATWLDSMAKYRKDGGNHAGGNGGAGDE